jgi:hypothetical protein
MQYFCTVIVYVFYFTCVFSVLFSLFFCFLRVCLFACLLAFFFVVCLYRAAICKIVAPQLYSTTLSVPRSRPTTPQKI